MLLLRLLGHTSCKPSGTLISLQTLAPPVTEGARCSVERVVQAFATPGDNVGMHSQTAWKECGCKRNTDRDCAYPENLKEYPLEGGRAHVPLSGVALIASLTTQRPTMDHGPDKRGLDSTIDLVERFLQVQLEGVAPAGADC